MPSPMMIFGLHVVLPISGLGGHRGIIVLEQGVEVGCHSPHCAFETKRNIIRG